MAEPAEVVPHDSGIEPPVADIALPVELVASNENTAEAGFIARTAMAALGWIARKNLADWLKDIDDSRQVAAAYRAR